MAPESDSWFERHWWRGLVERFDDGRRIEYPLGAYFNGVDSDAPSRLPFANNENWSAIRGLCAVLVMASGMMTMRWLGGVYEHSVGAFLVVVIVSFYLASGAFRILSVDPGRRTVMTPWRRQRAGEIVLPTYNWVGMILLGMWCFLMIALTWSEYWSPREKWIDQPGKHQAMMIMGVMYAALLLWGLVYSTSINWGSRRAAKVLAGGRSTQKREAAK